MLELSLLRKMITSDGERNLDISLAVEKGSFVGITGPSGGGKSTLLKILAGLMVPDAGTISLNGRLIFNSEKKLNLHTRFRRIGYMFQDYALFPNMTLRENILYGCFDSSLVDAYISRAGLDEVQHLYPSKLSGGQKQRCAFLRSALNLPELLLLDEPFSALDNTAREIIHELICDIRDEFNITVIMVSHDYPELFKLSSRVVELKCGTIVNDKPVRDFFLSKNISNKLTFNGTILEIRKSGVISIATISIGNTICQCVLGSENETQLHPGDRVIVASKAFNPVVRRIESDIVAVEGA